MSRQLGFITFLVVFSFSLGLWWSLKSSQIENSKHPLSPQRLRILSLPGILHPEVFEVFEREEGIKVSLVETTPEDFFSNLHDRASLYDLFAVSSNFALAMVQSQLIENFDLKELPNTKRISPDIMSVAHTTGSIQIPISWGINGFAKKTIEDFDFDSSESEPKKDIRMLRNSEALYSYLQSREPELSNWIKENNIAHIQSALEKNFKHLKLEKNDIDQNSILQISNGKFAFSEELEGWNFVVPKEGSQLWLSLLVLNKKSNKKESVHHFVNQMLSKNTNEQLVKLLKKASPLLEMNDRLPFEARAEFLNKIPLSRIQVLKDSLSYSPAWNSTLHIVFPDYFKRTFSVE